MDARPMPLEEFNKLVPRLQKIGVDPWQYINCADFGTISCDIAKVNLGMLKKTDFPKPEKYMNLKGR